VQKRHDELNSQFQAEVTHIKRRHSRLVSLYSTGLEQSEKPVKVEEELTAQSEQMLTIEEQHNIQPALNEFA
jgi:hypothetical protein